MGELRDRMVRDMQVRNYSLRTIEAYVFRVKGLARYYKRRPDQLTNDEVQGYLLHLRGERKLSASTCNQGHFALRFFYETTLGRPQASLTVPRMRQEQKLPEILSQVEVAAIIAAARRLRDQLLLMLAYGGGLRLSEISTLRHGDLDRERLLIRVEQGKGKKDRYTLLPESALGELDRYYAQYGKPGPWVFFQRSDPQKPIDTSIIQKAYCAAKYGAEIQKQGGIHALRHAFATHMVESGCDLPSLQRMLGHSNVTTTMRYLHVTAARIATHRSPLDRLEVHQSKPRSKR
ncbi:MAG: tyrosine-type recombinase/integrase [Polyangiaceae bacterium]|nr:tyrosine-type recombinase/integrase [Polyangiaceae bacterium]